jgi:hypothetical protein
VIFVSEGSTTDGTALVLVEASSHGTWRGAVLPGSAGLVIGGVGIGVAEVSLVLVGLAFVLVGAWRAMWWARACSTSRLLDREGALVWMYQGQVRDTLAWSDLRHVVFQRGARQVLWAMGQRGGGPFPSVLVDSRTDPPPPGFRQFAEVMILNRSELETANQALADACQRHRVTYHGPNSNW